MGGMGLAVKRQNPKAHQHSQEAEEFLEKWTEELQVRDAAVTGTKMTPDWKGRAQLEFLENKVALVREASRSQDWPQAFQLLEAIVMLMDQEDDWKGVSEEHRRRLHSLLMAAWVTSTRALLEDPEDLAEVPNYKFVLRKVLTEHGFEGIHGSEVLQAVVDGHNEEALEEDEEEAEGGSSLDFERECQAYLSHSDRAAPDELGGDHYDLTNPSSRRIHCKDSNQPQAPGQDALGTQGLDQQQALYAREEGGGDGGAGRLVALDDVAMRPILLRTVSHLGADHPLRLEVEEDIGAQVGTDAWAAEIDSAMQAAEAAGIPLPPLTAGGVGQSGEQQAADHGDAQRRPAARRTDSTFDLLGGAGRERMDGSSAGGGMFNVRSFSLFGGDGTDAGVDDFLEGDGCLQGTGLQGAPSTTAYEGRALPDMTTGSLASTQVMLPVVNNLAPAGPSSALASSTVAAMVGLPQLMVDNQGNNTEDDAGIDFFLNDSGTGRTNSLISPTSNAWGYGSVPEVDLGVQGAQDAAGGEEDYMAGGGEMYASWLMGSEDGDQGAGESGGWGMAGMVGAPVGGAVGGKRSASLVSLQRPPSKLSRTS